MAGRACRLAGVVFERCALLDDNTDSWRGVPQSQWRLTSAVSVRLSPCQTDSSENCPQNARPTDIISRQSRYC